MTRLHHAIGRVVLVLPAVSILAAAQVAQTPAAPTATFRSGVELVRVDVRASDADGRPVQDLQQDEIQVFEQGQPRPIVLFQHIAAAQGSYLEVARRTVGGEVSTNRGAPRGHLYVLVFDQAHITPGNEQRARLAAERFLTARTRPGDRVAVYGLPGPGPQLPFSSNVALAAAELRSVRGMLDRQGLSAVGPIAVHEAYQIVRGDRTLLQRVVERALASPAGADFATKISVGGVATPEASPTTALSRLIMEEARNVVARADTETRSFLLLLAEAVRNMASIEGRKAVILLSEGFYLDNVVREVEQVASAAAQASAVIYALDLNSRVPPVNAEEPAGALAQAEIQSRLEALGSLAAETDGELVLDASSRIDRTLDRIAGQIEDYYIVGFEPSSEALADRGAYRRITVRTTRPNVRLNVRTGYSPGDPALAQNSRRSIEAAFSAPFPQQALPIDLTTYVLRGTSGGAGRVFLSLEAELPVAEGAQASVADVAFVARRARDGRIAASATDILPLPRTREPGRTTGLGRLQLQFDLPPGEYLMRVVVREPGGTTGSVDRRFEVKRFDAADITASDLVLGARDDKLPVRALAYAGESLTGLVELYARSPRTLERATVAVDLIPSGTDEAAIAGWADLLEVKPAGSGASRAAAVAIPLTDVPPGSYLARAIVRVDNETVTELVRPVEVRSGSRPAPPVAASSPRDMNPRDLLGGSLARRLVQSIRVSASSQALVAAATLAAEGRWAQIDMALGPVAADAPVEVYALLGMARFSTRQYDSAAAMFESAFDRRPTEALLAFFLGWAHAAAGAEQRAISAWRAAVVADPALVPAYLALSDAYVRLEQFELAVQVLRAGLLAVPRSPELTTRLAELERR